MPLTRVLAHMVPQPARVLEFGRAQLARVLVCLGRAHYPRQSAIDLAQVRQRPYRGGRLLGSRYA